MHMKSYLHTVAAKRPAAKLLGGLFAALVIATVAQAQVIYNTGAQVVGGRDVNYQFGGSAGILADLPFTNIASRTWTNALMDARNPLVWEDNSASSSWLRPGRNLNAADDISNAALTTYVFRTTINLTGYDLSTASISLRAWEDDALSVFVGSSNSLATLQILNLGGPGQFSLSGFTASLTDVYFYVTNSIGPAGLRVEFNELGSTLNALTPVPEPSTYGLMGAGMVGAVVWLRRRRARSAV